MEPAKSGRSSCKQKGTACKHTNPIIEMGEVRIGRLDKEAGTYTNWNHLQCWRVPSKVWLAFPEHLDRQGVRRALTEMNEVLLSGFSELSEEYKILVVEYCMDKNNWARKTNTKPRKMNDSAEPSSTKHNTSESFPSSSKQSTSESVPSSSNFKTTNDTQSISIMNFQSASSSMTVSKAGGQFQLRPGLNGVQPNALAGKTFVLTGIFPEVGGGAGLNLGKDKMKAIIEQLGGRVCSAVSGKTDVLLVGKEVHPSSSSSSSSSLLLLLLLSSLAWSFESQPSCL